MDKRNFLKKAIKRIKNIPSDITQTHRFKKDIKRRAIIEADKIADEKVKDKELVSSTKIPFFTTWSKDPSLMTKERKKQAILRRKIRKELVDKKMKEAEEKGII